ncbi:hypothetical protein ACFOLL_12570 [Falsochrobactrum ovis]|uniref:Uncharacterized protein n=1 Tax=Falsochrobactrum ovis TaxID=1293442 RepID=A0A364JST6_9HYPH|nr:hypothetical protein [Falsochrobactrum ovis]RAK26385.1 hypothetical protein C7374_11471 [Falsochrobactrum ovis]
MIDTRALANGDVRIHIDGKTETIASATVAAFISHILWQTSKQAQQSGDAIPEGGAILHPTGVSVEFDRESNEPRIQLMFGKTLFSIAMPAGEINRIANTINEMIAKPS